MLACYPHGITLTRGGMFFCSQLEAVRTGGTYACAAIAGLFSVSTSWIEWRWLSCCFEAVQERRTVVVVNIRKLPASVRSSAMLIPRPIRIVNFHSRILVRNLPRDIENNIFKFSFASNFSFLLYEHQPPRSQICVAATGEDGWLMTSCRW